MYYHDKGLYECDDNGKVNVELIEDPSLAGKGLMRMSSPGGILDQMRVHYTIIQNHLTRPSITFFTPLILSFRCSNSIRTFNTS